MTNVPLIPDALGLRASAYYDHEGGYIDSVYDGQRNYNDYSTSGGRLKGLWKIDDYTNVRVNVLYQKLVSEGRPQVFMPGDPPVTAASGPAEPFNVTRDYQTVKFVPDPFDDKLPVSTVRSEWA